MSDFAEYLFNFACSKLESDPELDMRQQVLHSNLIRQILLLQSTQADSQHQSENDLHFSSKPSLLTPQSTQPERPYPSSPYLRYPQSPSEIDDYPQWSPFTFDDELDRTLPKFDDDIDMEDPGYVNINGSETSRIFPTGLCHNHVQGSCDNFQPSYFSEPQQPHDSYLTHLNQAQADWLDSVLEDLMEEDQQDSDYGDEDDDDDEEEEDEEDKHEYALGREHERDQVHIRHSTMDHTGAHFFDRESNMITTSAPSSSLHASSTSSTLSPWCLDEAQELPPERNILNDPIHPSKHVRRQEIGSNETQEPHAACFQEYQQHHQQPQLQARRPIYLACPSYFSPVSPSTPLSTSPPSPRLQPILVKPPLSTSPPLSPPRTLEAYFSDSFFHACPPCLGFHSSPSPSPSQREEVLRYKRFDQLKRDLSSSCTL
ncbi:hypothetical protein BG006_001031 [Podila minutissima]|uniref:Uncharacterized protein n=1 Tax=Podila minutissima TaxID=64525 RepID=A0A9P5SAQ9_9FUNG|nr:hypothetical protein BG006_001031 [Podila minutissima]